MKMRGLFVLFLALLPFSPSMALEKGREYVAVPKPQQVDTGNKVEVREFFWYGCPHCYTLEPHVTKWVKSKPANAEFIRTPATAPRWMIHAQAYYAFAALGATEKTHTAMFRAMQEQKRPLNDEQSLADFAKEQGIDPAKFKEAFNSFSVNASVDKARRLSEAFQIASVPTFVIDGKYVTSASMAGSEEGLMKVISQLVAMAAKERGISAKPAKK